MGLIDDCPEVEEIDQKIAEVAAGQDEYLASTNALMADWKADHARWVEVDQAEALRTGKQPKRPKPTPPLAPEERGARLHDYVVADRRLREQRRDKIAELTPRIEQQALQMVEQIVAEAREHVDPLNALAGRLNNLHGELHLARRALYEVDLGTGTGGVDPVMPVALTGASLADAVSAGRALYEQPPRRLGFSGPAFTNAPAAELRFTAQPDPTYPREPSPQPVPNRGRQV